MRTPKQSLKVQKRFQQQFVGKLFALKDKRGFHPSNLKPKEIGMMLSAETFGFGSVRVVWLIGQKLRTAEYWLDDFAKIHKEIK